MRLLFTAFLSVFFFCSNAQDAVPGSIYGFHIAAANGGTIDLSAYKGKKILIVNTPIELDNARQYSELEELYQKNKDRLVIIGVLANDFEIEPGSNKGSLAHREKNYRVTFPLASKLLIRGPEMAPLYKWLTEMKYNNLKDTEIKWDFQKYLINESGKLVAVFDPKIKANSPEIAAALSN